MPVRSVADYLDRHHYRYHSYNHPPADRALDIAHAAHVPDTQLAKTADKVAQLIKDWRLQFGNDATKGNWREAYQKPEMQTALNRVSEAIDMLYLVMKSSLGRSDLIDNAFERLALCKARLLKLTDMQQSGVSLWFETTRLHVSLHLTPLSIADKFRDIVAADERSWVFTSATLSVNHGFSHYTTHKASRCS